MSRSSRGSSFLVALASILGAMSLASPVRADQFILFDATFEYTWEDANNSSPSKSHFYVTDSNFMNLERPENWVSPVNYRDGSVHIRIEVLSRPAGGQDVGWALCYIANVGSYGCPYTDYYTTTGVFEKDVAMDAFWTSGPITWESGIKQVDLVYTINNSGSGHVHNFPELAAQTTPTEVRITMVQVSQGDTYDPSILEEPGGSGGAGVGGSGSGGAILATGGSESGGTSSSGGEASSSGGSTSGGTPGEDSSDGEVSTGGNKPSGCDLGRNSPSGGWWAMLALGLGLTFRRFSPRPRHSRSRSRGNH